MTLAVVTNITLRPIHELRYVIHTNDATLTVRC